MNNLDTTSPQQTKRGIATLVVLAFAFSSMGYIATIASGETSVLLVAGPAIRVRRGLERLEPPLDLLSH